MKEKIEPVLIEIKAEAGVGPSYHVFIDGVHRCDLCGITLTESIDNIASKICGMRSINDN